MLAVKFTAIVSKQLLSLLNLKHIYVQSIFKKIQQANNNNNNDYITVEQLQKYLTDEVGIEAMTDFPQLLENILLKSNYTSSTHITQLDWKIYMKSFYLQPQHNTNLIIQQLGNYKQNEREHLELFRIRLTRVSEQAKIACMQIFIDAEQTYFQTAIDDLAQQLQLLYNTREQNVVFNTFQTYLQSTIDRLQHEIRMHQYLGTNPAVKLVRGAYMVEESELAITHHYPNPICNTYEDTSHSYHSCLSHVLANITTNGQVLVATHNVSTCTLAEQLIQKYQLQQQQVLFAQLQGLSDEVTFGLQQRGYQVAKYVPYGPTWVMIPYLCRRAVESFQMIANVDVQIAYIKKALKNKLFWSRDQYQGQTTQNKNNK